MREERVCCLTCSLHTSWHLKSLFIYSQGNFVHAGNILATQRLMRYHPGAHVSYSFTFRNYWSDEVKMCTFSSGTSSCPPSLSLTGGGGNQQDALCSRGRLRQVHQGSLYPTTTQSWGHPGHHQAAQRCRALQDFHQRPTSETGGQV